MQTTIPKREFKEALTGLARVINTRTSLPILRGIRFSANPNGIVKAEATDLDSTATFTFNSASAEGAGSFIVDIDSLKQFAQGNGPDMLTFDCTEANQVSVTTNVGGQALRRTLAAFDPEDWPDMAVPNMRTAPVPGFMDTYRNLERFASKDETRYVLNSVHLDVSDKHDNGAVMVSTDGRRLANKNHMTLPLTESCILRTSKFLAWSRLPADAEVGLTKGKNGSTIGVKAGPWVYTTKAVDGTYPNWRQVVPQYNDVENRFTLSEADCSLLLSALQSLPGQESVTLVIRDGKLSVWARGVDDKDWTTLDIPDATVAAAAVAYTTVDRGYLRQAIEAGLFRDIRFQDNLSPIVSEDGNGGLHVLMPMHGNGPEEIVKATEALLLQAAMASGENPDSTVEDTTDDSNAEPEDSPEPQQTTTTQAAATPAEVPVPAPEHKKKGQSMNTEKTTPETTQPDAGTNALDRALAAFEQTKAAVREAATLLATLAAELKTAVRDQKAQAADLEKARGTLAKLQAMSL